MTRRANAPLRPRSSRLAGLILFGQGGYIHAKAMLAQVLLERAFTETIATGRETKPWSWADTWPVARIEVKRIDASTIVLAGSSGQALAFGPGHVERTPDAGERGVAVYSAHRDTHFRFLGCRDRRRNRRHAARRQDFPLPRRPHSIVRFDASGIDPLPTATNWCCDLLAVRRHDAGARALSPARHHDRAGS